MKKYLTILLLALLFFNLVGYRVWFYYLEERSNQQFSTMVEHEQYRYDDADLLTVKVPLSLPYTSNWSSFENYNGSIEVDGKHYNYVKRKVSNDTLILLCLPNDGRNRITDIKNYFEKMAAGETGSADNKAATSGLLLKLLTANYYDNSVFYTLGTIPVSTPFYPGAMNENLVTNHAIGAPWHPPDNGSHV